MRWVGQVPGAPSLVVGDSVTRARLNLRYGVFVSAAVDRVVPPTATGGAPQRDYRVISNLDPHAQFSDLCNYDV